MDDKNENEAKIKADIAENWGCVIVLVALILVAGAYFILELLVNAGVI